MIYHELLLQRQIFEKIVCSNDGCQSFSQRRISRFRSGTNPTSHVDICTCPLRDIGPPRLRSRAVDTNCPTARRCACVMRPDSESRCVVADGVVDHCGRPIRARRCRDWLAGLTAKRGLPCSETTGGSVEGTRDKAAAATLRQTRPCCRSNLCLCEESRWGL